ncbi:MAG: DUF2892 domain-containing protein [Phycisphaerales bacterium]|nr:DUF2892 domain-containing protein [Phycisphaerales bacterium]
MGDIGNPTPGPPGARGRVGSPDRVQRLIIGAILMSLNLIGLAQSPDWPKWVALVFQIELLATALLGWCPVYWACRVHARS